MIGCGHFLGYMRKYGNLNKYSQKGWEALNALITFFFFCCTKKGGKNSGGTFTELKSKLVPIGRLVQRRLLWVCNLVSVDLWDDGYKIPSHHNDVFSDDVDNRDIIFDSDVVQTN